MRVAMQVEQPGDVRVTLTTTMTVSQWQVLSSALTRGLDGGGNWHADVSAFRNAVNDALEKIRDNVKGESVPLVGE